jgi:DNA invertase Pin-like site-specific DNA recombinase
MKKAIGYVRISTEDQSNFSISGQENLIKDFCIKQNFELIEVFKDEGQSAKNFDRHDWKNLETFIKKNYKDVDSLIVAKFDRFSRNLRQALETIERIEGKYNITIISVNENIGLHRNSPYYFQMRTQMLLGSEVEWRMIRDRTKFGIYTAQKNGRWINAAPFGYTNARDEQKKPIIVINTEKSKAVEIAYNMFLNGVSFEEIRKHLKTLGFVIKGNSAISDLLKNPVYAGLIKVSAYYDDPEQLVKGIHQPIISEDIWWKAQAKINSRKTQIHSIIRDEVPLRGVLKCHCNKLLTAGNSKSGSGKYFWYYKCNTHLLPNLRADVLHAKFDEILKHLTFSKAQIQNITDLATKKLKIKLEENTKSLETHKQELRKVELKIEQLENKYISNEIEKDVYFKWKPQFVLDRQELQQTVKSYSEPIEAIISKFKSSLHELENISYLYQILSTVQKQAFINIVFYNSLYYYDDCYRTENILPIFESKALVLQQKKLLIIEKLSSQNLILASSAPQRNSIELFPSTQLLINWINSIKAA